MSHVLSGSIRQVRILALALFAVVALIGSSVAPAFAEQDGPGLPMDLRGYCESLGYTTVIFHPQDLKKPNGRSWRCANVTYTVNTSSNSSCEVGAGVEVSIKKQGSGKFNVSCSFGNGESLQYEVTSMKSIDINAVCAWQYREWDPVAQTWVLFYKADSYDWSNPYALGCYSTLPKF